MAFGYLMMLVFTCANIWNYLIKLQMYRSYHMTMAYLLLLLNSVCGIVYELFMGIHCGDHDCLSLFLVQHDSSEHITNSTIKAIVIFWAVRQ